MSVRRSVLALLGAAMFAVAACSSTGSSAVPSVAIPSLTVPNPASLNPASITAGLQGFCADFASKVTAKWPNIDAATAASLGPVMQEWANKPELGTVKADIATIATWVTTQATAGSVASPPADVNTAFDHVKTFAANNC
jgi:hypothetical protein